MVGTKQKSDKTLTVTQATFSLLDSLRLGVYNHDNKVTLSNGQNLRIAAKDVTEFVNKIVEDMAAQGINDTCIMTSQLGKSTINLQCHLDTKNLKVSQITYDTVIRTAEDRWGVGNVTETMGENALMAMVLGYLLVTRPIMFRKSNGLNICDTFASGCFELWNDCYYTVTVANRIWFTPSETRYYIRAITLPDDMDGIKSSVPSVDTNEIKETV